MKKNIVIAALLITSTIMTAATLSVQASKSILQRDYEFLEGRYTQLYINGIQADNQD